MPFGKCPKCRQNKHLTKHHVFPRRHFGRGNKNKTVVRICRECHDELEELIPYERQPIAFYPHIVNVFLAL